MMRGKNQDRRCRRYYHTRDGGLSCAYTYRRVIRSETFPDRRPLQGPLTSRRRRGPIVANRRSKKKHEKHDDVGGIVVVGSRGRWQPATTTTRQQRYGNTARRETETGEPT